MTSDDAATPPTCVSQLTPPLRDGVVFELGNVRYVVCDGTPYEPPVLRGQPLLVTALALATAANRPTREQLDLVLHSAKENDDVFREEFLQGVILLSQGDHDEALAKDARALLSNRGNIWVDVRSQSEPCLTPGTYAVDKSVLWRVCRLYDDHQKAFLTALKPTNPRGSPEAFEQLQIQGNEYTTLSVAVPSRLQSQGLRIAVKDLFRVHGMKTSLCNSSYYQLSAPAKESAEAVQTLVDQGHHIMVLTQLSSMIAREEPSDAVDFQTAFNPRGDGYQSPAGSSSGSAAAVASYEWIDCAIGSDTSGSGRRPALVNGVFQFRPSHDAAPLCGMIKTFLQFDTPCIFARDLEVLEDVLSAWLPKDYHELGQSSSNLEIIYPLDYLPTRIPAQMEIINSFVDDMAAHLNATVKRVSIRQSWESAPPRNASFDIEDFLKDVITHTYYYSFYHSSEKFRAEHFQKFGRRPYVIPFVEQRWASGAAVAAGQHKQGLRKLETYRAWLLRQFFRCKKTLMVLPISPVEPHYRDERTQSPTSQTATDELFVSPILRSPDIVVPVGEIPYRSRITGNQEQLPVAVSVVGAPGMDYWVLYSMRTVLQKSGRNSKVKPGSRLF